MAAGVYKRTKEHNKKISESHMGEKNPMFGKPSWNKGNKGYLAGEKHWNWKGGINPINDTIRKSFEYKLWRTAVFERDNYTCIWCGVSRENEGDKRAIFNADHIKPFSLFPELRFAIDNGRTLCKECHMTTDSYGVKLPKDMLS